MTNKGYKWHAKMKIVLGRMIVRNLVGSPMFIIKKCHIVESHTCEKEYGLKDIDSTFGAKYSFELFAEPSIRAKKN